MYNIGSSFHTACLHRQTNVYDATDVNVTVTADYSDFDVTVML